MENAIEIRDWGEIPWDVILGLLFLATGYCPVYLFYILICLFFPWYPTPMGVESHLVGYCRVSFVMLLALPSPINLLLSLHTVYAVSLFFHMLLSFSILIFLLHFVSFSFLLIHSRTCFRSLLFHAKKCFVYLGSAIFWYCFFLFLFSLFLLFSFLRPHFPFVKPQSW